MSFTGSPEVGRLVAEACGRNLVPVKLELGGKGAAVVFDDVDSNDTVDEAGPGHHLPHRPGLLRRHPLARPPVDLRSLRRGLRRATRTRSRSATSWTAVPQMGPVVSEKQRQRVLGYLHAVERKVPTLFLEGGVAEVARRRRVLREARTAGRLAGQRRRPRGNLRTRRVPGALPRRRRGDPDGQPRPTTDWPTASGRPT